MNKLEQAVWIAQSLFNRGKATGSSANLSFKDGDKIYITGSGTSFGTLEQSQFAIVDLNGTHLDGIAASKELPLHLIYYNKSEKIQAVIHTHSIYSTLWSCASHQNTVDCMPKYTPYLKMKLGTIGLIPYASPGSAELFEHFKSAIDKSDGFLLANHGPLVGAKSLMDAFFALEELEESARVAYEITNKLHFNECK